jgi:hypothetical protein
MALAVRHPTGHTGQLTFADLQRLPDDGLRHEIVELVDGRFVARADVAGDESCSLAAPFAVTVAPSDLVR